MYEVENSPWIAEMKNRIEFTPAIVTHCSDGRKHYVACFKDVKFESVCRSMSEDA